MNFRIYWVTITPDMLVANTAPVFEVPAIVMPRDDDAAGAESHTRFTAGDSAKVGEFWVPQQPLLAETVTLAVTRSGEFVRVPVWAYRTIQRNKSCIMATGMELASRAIAAYLRQCKKLPGGVICVLGTDCIPLEEDAYRCFANIVLQT